MKRGTKITLITLAVIFGIGLGYYLQSTIGKLFK